MRTKLRYWLIALTITSILAFSNRALSVPLGYGVDNSNDLYSIDLSTATATLIGNTGSFMEALAVSPSGALFATDSNGSLYSLNLLTGASTFIGSTGLGNIEGLDFNGTTLLGTNFSNPTTVFAINPSNATVTPVATTVPPQGVVRTLAVSGPNTGLLLADSPSSQTLHSIDLTTGATIQMGTVISNAGIYGIDFFNTTLYGLGGEGEVVTIDPVTGATTLVGDTGDQIWLALAIPAAASASVPETTNTLAILIPTFLLLGCARCRYARSV